MTFPAVDTLPSDIRDLTEEEVDASIRWLWRFSTPSGAGTGLVLDKDDLPDVATVAATGFALAAWCVGVDRGILSAAVDGIKVAEAVARTMTGAR